MIKVALVQEGGGWGSNIHLKLTRLHMHADKGVSCLPRVRISRSVLLQPIFFNALPCNKATQARLRASGDERRRRVESETSCKAINLLHAQEYLIMPSYVYSKFIVDF